MKRIGIALAVAGVVTAGCGQGVYEDSPSGFKPNKQQNALGNLAHSSGYEIYGIPDYDGKRWTINVHVPKCKTDVTLASKDAPKSTIPKSFLVSAVGTESFVVIMPKEDPENLPASDLKKLHGMKRLLGCAS